jgi:thiol-disulfide isomerase/thioredoxin
MQKIIFIVAILLCSKARGQNNTPLKDRILYGVATQDSLLQDPFKKWYMPNYTDYKPNAQTVAELKKQNMKEVSIKIFMGTWCGDSKREVPRFYKLIDTLGINPKSIQLVTMGTGDSLNKKSPTEEEKGLGIFRVPVFIIYKNGKEINRINEYPVLSLEKDMLSIVKGEAYTPNYASFATITKWLYEGTLLDDNINTNGLANHVRNKVSGENELNSLGYLLLNHQLKKEALRVFKINYALFPNSTNVRSSLGEGFLKNGDKAKAITFLELALKENKDPEAFREIIDLLYEAKGVK